MPRLGTGLTIVFATFTIVGSAAAAICQPTPSIEASTQPADAQPPANLIETLISALSSQTGVARSDISFKSAVATQWADSCLGVAKPDEMCAQVITPGYQVTLSTPLQDYEFHTDRSGQRFRMVPISGQSQ